MPRSKPKVQLIHWKPAEAEPCVQALRQLGYQVKFKPVDQAALKEMRQDPPDAFVIDLSRLPSQGRDIGIGLRQYKSSRSVPLVFVEGADEKVAGVKKHLPDATFTVWDKIESALKKALATRPVDPVVPESSLAGYAGTPLPKKLGIKADMVLALLKEPKDFRASLGALPDGVEIRTQARGQCDLIIWFVTSRAEYTKRLSAVSRALAPKGGLWVAWPKQASGVKSDLTQAEVRRVGLDSGLVDHKICAIDEVWSGLRFVHRK